MAGASGRGPEGKREPLSPRDRLYTWRMSFFTWFQMVSVVVPTACFFFTCSAIFCFNSSSELAFPCHLQA